jgi:hypothetical protein
MAECLRLLALTRKTLGGVSSDDPELERVEGLLVRLEAAVSVTSASYQHELDAAKVVEENGIAVLTAIEGKTSMSTGFSVRRDFMVKDLTKTKVDAATLAQAGRGGGGGGGRGRGGGGAPGRGRGAGGARGGRGGAAAPRLPLTDAQKAKQKCYSCQGYGHLSNACPNKPN